MKQGIAFPHLNVIEDHEYDRRKWIGGSEAGAIIGFGAEYRGEIETPMKVWERKMREGPEVIDPELQRFFNRRKRLEPFIRETLTEEFDAEIISFNERYVDPEVPFFCAEIDFAWRDRDTGEIGTGEIKTVSPFAFRSEKSGWGESGTDQAPVHYQAQVHHGLGVTGAGRGIIVAAVGWDQFLFYPINRDEKLLAMMRGKCRTFMEENVLKRIPPEPLIVDDIERLCANFSGVPVELTEEIAAKLGEREAIKSRIKIDQEAVEELDFLIYDHVRKQWGLPDLKFEAGASLDLPGENALLMFNGRIVGKWNRQSRPYTDTKRLKIDLPEVAAKYEKRSFFRRFYPTKEKG